MYEDEYVPNQCEHIRDTGVRCGSPAMRGRDFCYYHRRLHDSPNLPGDSQYVLPALESEHAIQLATTHILRSMLKGKISRQDAATMFQGIRIARVTLRDAKKELAETPITAFEWDITPGMERVNGLSENECGTAAERCGAAALGRDVQNQEHAWEKSLCGSETLVRDHSRASNPVHLDEVIAELAASSDSTSNPTSPNGEVEQLLAQRVTVGTTTPKIPPSPAGATPSGNSQQRRRARRMALRNPSQLSEAITA